MIPNTEGFVHILAMMIVGVITVRNRTTSTSRAPTALRSVVALVAKNLLRRILLEGHLSDNVLIVFIKLSSDDAFGTFNF